MRIPFIQIILFFALSLAFTPVKRADANPMVSIVLALIKQKIKKGLITSIAKKILNKGLQKGASKVVGKVLNELIESAGHLCITEACASITKTVISEVIDKGSISENLLRSGDTVAKALKAGVGNCTTAVVGEFMDHINKPLEKISGIIIDDDEAKKFQAQVKSGKDVAEKIVKEETFGSKGIVLMCEVSALLIDPVQLVKKAWKNRKQLAKSTIKLGGKSTEAIGKWSGKGIRSIGRWGKTIGHWGRKATGAVQQLGGKSLQTVKKTYDNIVSVLNKKKVMNGIRLLSETTKKLRRLTNKDLWTKKNMIAKSKNLLGTAKSGMKSAGRRGLEVLDTAGRRGLEVLDKTGKLALKKTIQFATKTKHYVSTKATASKTAIRKKYNTVKQKAGDKVKSTKEKVVADAKSTWKTLQEPRCNLVKAMIDIPGILGIGKSSYESKKEAESAAIIAGKGNKPLHHKNGHNPGENPHFHPVDKKGKIIKDGKEYDYPPQKISQPCPPVYKKPSKLTKKIFVSRGKSATLGKMLP